jgi:hypothetical protein
MKGSLSRFLCNRLVPHKVVTHQLTLVTSKLSDTETMRFSLKGTAHAAFSSAACRKSGKHDSMRLG